MRFHSNRNDRSWHTADRRIREALRQLDELILALRAAGLPPETANQIAGKALRHQ